MYAMILAAGRGERMRPLTDRQPKPLLRVGGRPLIEYHLRNLKRAGVERVVVNSAHRGEALRRFVGAGERWGLEILHSAEFPKALGTGGGIRQALPLLGKKPFIVVSADIWSDFDFADLPDHTGHLAHLVLVPNPPHHPTGDFALEDCRVRDQRGRYTYSGIAVLQPALIEDRPGGCFPLAPILLEAIRKHRVSGQLHRGLWRDVGTPERLRETDLLASGFAHHD